MHFIVSITKSFLIAFIVNNKTKCSERKVSFSLDVRSKTFYLLLTRLSPFITNTFYSFTELWTEKASS